ncbi:MAG: hypothetical protein DRP56_02080 [Planctomycetota bacterium]|nr:MAG: hypothetical protein DRP56_02080 [Planctomycetota bacterium]
MRKIVLILWLAVALAAPVFGLRADINNDGRVDFADLAILAEEWLMSEQYGPELVTNGGFDTDTAWTKGGDWAWLNGTMRLYSSEQGVLSQSLPVVAGTAYEISYDNVLNFSPDTIVGYLGGQSFAVSLAANAVAVVCGSSDSLIRFEVASATGVIILDDVSVRKILQAESPNSLAAEDGNSLAAAINTLAHVDGNSLGHPSGICLASP